MTHQADLACSAGEAPPEAVEESERRNLRVLHVNSGNMYGGVETILVTLARLRGRCPAMEPHFAVCLEGRLSQELEAAGAVVHVLGKVRISRPWTVHGARRNLRALLGRECFDLVVCHMPWSLAVFGPVVHAAGPKLVFWAHAFHTGGNWLERLARRARPDFAIANSRFSEAGLKNVFPGAPHDMLYAPLELTPRRNAPADRQKLRAQYGAKPDTVVIAQVSRIEACKGHRVHLEALEKLKELATPWVCWMVGGAQRPEEQKLLAELQSLAHAQGLDQRVFFLGQRQDVAELLGAADIFCQPNETPDSFGFTFVEALWAGRAVLTSALGGALEIVDESCGLLVEPANAGALAEGLRQLIEDPELRARLGNAGPARALALCEPGRQMGALYRLMRSAINGERRS